MPERAQGDEDISTTLRNVEPASSGDSERENAPAASDAPTKRISHGSDTLLSAPVTSQDEPAAVTDRDSARSDGRVEAHVEELERRIDQLEARVRVLELRQPHSTPRWLIWVLFLFGLAIAFQLTRQI